MLMMFYSHFYVLQSIIIISKDQLLSVFIWVTTTFDFYMSKILKEDFLSGLRCELCVLLSPEECWGGQQQQGVGCCLLSGYSEAHEGDNLDWTLELSDNKPAFVLLCPAKPSAPRLWLGLFLLGFG